MPEVVTSVARANGLPSGQRTGLPSESSSPLGRLYELACAYESWASSVGQPSINERMGDAAAFSAAARACADVDEVTAVVAVAACQAILDLRQAAAQAPCTPCVVLARSVPRRSVRSRV